MRPSINHSLLSPSGRMSKAARTAALKLAARELFPPGFWDTPMPTEAEANAAKITSLRRTAANLRNLSGTKKSIRKATELEAEAAALEAQHA